MQFLLKPQKFSFFYIDIGKFIPKFTWKCAGSRIVKTILTRKNKMGRITLPNIKPYTVVTVINKFCIGKGIGT